MNKPELSCSSWLVSGLFMAVFDFLSHCKVDELEMESEEAKKELEKGKQVQRRKVRTWGILLKQFVLGRQQLGTASSQSSVLATLTTT